ncbi:hypothetical protein Tco_0721330 [Tanacetum coccineum]
MVYQRLDFTRKRICSIPNTTYPTAYISHPGIPNGKAVQTTIPNTASFYTEDLDAYDSDCDDVSNTKAVLMDNLSNYGSDVISSQHVASPVIDDEETLILEEVSRSKMLAKQNDPMSKEKKVNTTPINYVELNRLSEDFGKRFVPQQELSDEQAFWLQTSHPNTDQSASSPIKIEAPECFNLDAELLKSQNAYNDLSKSYSQLENIAAFHQNVQLDIELISHRLQNNKDAHEDYLKEDIVNADNHCCDGLVEKRRENRIPIEKLVVVTPMNKVKESIGLKYSTIETQKPEIKVYSKRPKQVKSVGSSKTSKIVESTIAINSEPTHLWGSNATDVPSSSLVNDRLSIFFSGTIRFGNDQVAKIMGYGDYQLGNIIISRVYYVEGLGHNLFSVGQFCDADLENSSGDSGPDLSFDKSASLKRLFGLAIDEISIVAVSKLILHFSQLGPLGLNKVITFEVLCRSLQIEPTVTLFRVFHTLYKQGDWFSFTKRRAPSPVCIDDNRSCMKHWKSGFFLIDRRAIPNAMVWRHPHLTIDDPRPATSSFNMADVHRLSAHVIKLRDMPKGVLVLSGLSRVWKNRFCDPVLRGADGNVMGQPFKGFPSLPATADVVIPNPTTEDLAAGTPSSKILAVRFIKSVNYVV